MCRARIRPWHHWEMHGTLGRRRLALIWRRARFRRRYASFHISVFSLVNFLQRKLDDMPEKIVVKLKDKFPPGLCPLHHDLPCFHYCAADLHFNLNHPWLLVWAHAIKSGMAIYEKIPILSLMFKAGQALKCMSKSSMDSPMPPTTPPTMEPSRPMPTQEHMPVISK